MNALATTVAPTLPAWLDASAWPHQRHRIPVDGGAMSVADLGAGDPILLVHGTPTWGYLWRAVAPALATNHRVVIPDHLGFGLSDKPAGADGSLQAHAHRFGEIIDALGLDRVVLVLHDVGGPIGLTWAARNPERVRGIVLLNTFVCCPGTGAGRVLLDLFATAPGRWLYRVTGLSPRFLLPSGFADRSRLSPHTHAAYLHALGTARARHLMADVPRLLVGPELAELHNHLGTLARTPVEIAWGLGDPILGPHNLAALRAAYPDAPVTEIADCGHFTPEEAHDEVLAAVRRLLARV